MSYRSRRKSYRGSSGTNFVRQRYQYFVDMQTKSDTMQVITITAGGVMPQVRLRPFFGAFKYFKLGKVSIRFVPAATLPVDPTGLSYETGEQTVDPRDQMNPGLVRITNGEDVSYLSSVLTGSSAEKAYYSTMLDNRWYKFQLQSGFKRTAKPLLWNVGQTAQTMAQGLVANYRNGQPLAPVASNDSNVGAVITEGVGTDNLATERVYKPNAENTQPLYISNPMDAALMQTGRVRMGWMPTDMFNSGAYGPNVVPEVDLITCVLPKAYKTSYFYRVYIEEEVLFKDPVATYPIVSTFTGQGEDMSALTMLNTGALDRYTFVTGISGTPGNTGVSTTYRNSVNKLNGEDI